MINQSLSMIIYCGLKKNVSISPFDLCKQNKIVWYTKINIIYYTFNKWCRKEAKINNSKE